MSSEQRQRSLDRAHQRFASSLAVLATFGLVVIPLVHAEQHASEAALSRKQALAQVFRFAFQQQRTPQQEQLLQDALEVAFPRKGDKGGQRDAHGHSHGPGRHGSGSLAHFDVAVHGPPPAPTALPPAPLPPGQLFAHRSLLLTPRYTTPEQSQAPPAA